MIFSETLGTVTVTTAIAAHEAANAFDNDGLTFSGAGDLRATGFSTGYAGASGSANVFLTSNSSKTFRIDGINTLGHTVGSVGMTFGAFKNTTASDMATLVLEYSTDGSSWSAISIPGQPTGIGTSVWRLVSIPTTFIPIASNVSLRWTNTDSTTQFRLDDITLTAVPEPAAALLGVFGLLGLLRRRR